MDIQVEHVFEVQVGVKHRMEGRSWSLTCST